MRLGCDGVVANLVKVAAVQFEHRADNKQYNLGRVGHFAGRAAAAGARLVVCPEMCLTGYWHLRRLDAEALRGLAEPADGPSVSAVRLLARRLGAGVGAGFLESADGQLAIVVQPHFSAQHPSLILSRKMIQKRYGGFPPP